MNQSVSKQQWVEMFKEIGLDEPTMGKWHAVFEQRHPEAHDAFLQWLSIGEAEIKKIRENSRS